MLDRELDLVAVRLERLADEFLLVPHNNHDALAAGLQARVHNRADHRAAAHLVADLGKVGLHACPLARGKDDRFKLLMLFGCVAHRSVQRRRGIRAEKTAPPRFELGLTGSKPAVLPLHHGALLCGLKSPTAALNASGDRGVSLQLLSGQGDDGLACIRTVRSVGSDTLDSRACVAAAHSPQVTEHQRLGARSTRLRGRMSTIPIPFTWTHRGASALIDRFRSPRPSLRAPQRGQS